MTNMNDRERGFEAKFALDSEQEFKAAARRNRMLGRWAGEKLGLSGQALDDYCGAVIRADCAEAGDDDVLRKVAADLNGKAEAVEIRAQMDALLLTARQQVASGSSGS